MQSLQKSIEEMAGAPERYKEIDRIVGDDESRGRLKGFFFVPEPKQESDGHKLDDHKLPESHPLLCNIVLQGGGVLGLAHIGFLAGLERAGVRFAGAAGTSAGAIVATALVCARKSRLDTPVAQTLLSIIADMPLEDFIDGKRPVRNLIRAYLRGENLVLNGLLSTFPFLLSLLGRKRGLNPGLRFEDWLALQFDKLGIRTNRQLMEALGEIRLQLTAHGIDQTLRSDYLLRIIATAMPVGLKGTFPRDLEYVRPEYLQASPAIFVRASMAVPGFFEPKYMEVERDEWRKNVRKRLKSLLPTQQIEDFAQLEALGFVDGGLLSNLPVDAFEDMRWPGAASKRFPTIIVTLVHWNRKQSYRFDRTARGLGADMLRIFDAIRVQRDRDALRRVEDDPWTEIVPIDTGAHNWLNFTLRDDDKADLYRLGLDAAVKFLKERAAVKAGAGR